MERECGSDWEGGGEGKCAGLVRHLPGIKRGGNFKGHFFTNSVKQAQKSPFSVVQNKYKILEGIYFITPTPRRI